MASAPLLQVPAKLPKTQLDGVLTLLPSKLIWTPDDPSQTDQTEIDTHSITGWQKAKGKPLLRIVTSSGPSVYEFEDVGIREAVEKALQPFISSSAPSRSHDPHRAVKEQLLTQNKDLKTVYETLVQSGVLSESEFWSGRRQLLDSGASVGPRKDQRVGLASTLMPDIMEGNEDSNTVSLRPELIEQIFAERPHVKEAYRRHVPADLDEKEFWVRYCKHQEAIKKKRRKMIEGDVQGAQEIDDEFADLFGLHDAETDKDASGDAHDPVIDLSLDDRDVGDGYGLRNIQQRPLQEKTSSHAFGAPDIATEINHHAVVVLQGISRATGDAAEGEQGALEDLKGKKRQTSISLQIRKDANKGRSAKPAKRQKTDRAPQQVAPSKATSILDSKSIQSLSSSSVKVLMELHYGGEMKEEDTTGVARGVSPADGLPLELLDELRTKTLVVNELLHHFWASYPVNSHAKETHIAKIKETFVTHFNQMKGMRSLAKTPQESALIHQLLKPMQAQINAAIDKYTTELETRHAHLN